MTTITAMDAAAADWIAKTVLTKAYRTSCGGVDLIRMCPCQYGECGYCGMGKHDKCTSRNNPPRTSTLAHILNRKGGVLASVRGTGAPCRWICSCPTCAELPPIEQTEKVTKLPPPRRPSGQLKPGDTVWLTPKTLGCPAICYREPRCTIVKIPGHGAILTVRLDTEPRTEHQVHQDNVRRSDPAAARSNRPEPAPRPVKRKPLPDGYAEITLF